MLGQARPLNLRTAHAPRQVLPSNPYLLEADVCAKGYIALALL